MMVQRECHSDTDNIRMTFSSFRRRLSFTCSLAYNVSQLIHSFHETSQLNLDNETGKAKNVNIAHRYFSDVPQEDTLLTLWFPDNN